MPVPTKSPMLCPWCPGATEAPREQVQGSICKRCARKLIEGFFERHPARKAEVARAASAASSPAFLA